MSPVLPEPSPSLLDVVPERSLMLTLPGLTAEYARLPAGTGPSLSPGLGLGAAFTPQRRAVWRVDGVVRTGSFAPGAVFITPPGGLEWAEWSDVSESVEMWLDPALLAELSGAEGEAPSVVFDYREAVLDPVILNIASRVRAAVLRGSQAMEQLSDLPLLLASHMLERYHGIRVRPSGRVRKIERTVLARVTEYIDAHLHEPLSVLELAAVAGRSPYHFAKAFKAATGSPPHAFVAARRMERALVLLQQTSIPVSRVARLVGFQSLTHFRRRFHQAWGEPTGRYRRSGRPRRAA
jgi:AraC family transcriptional regulator